MELELSERPDNGVIDKKTMWKKEGNYLKGGLKNKKKEARKPVSHLDPRQKKRQRE